MQMTGAEAVVQTLTEQGIDTVFGIVGAHTIEIYEALYHKQDDITHITARHECGAGFMADGYARAGGDVGVCLAITGPGVTNAATALAQAYSDSSPLLLITSQSESRFADQYVGAHHQLKDQLAVTGGCTAYNQRVEDPQQVPHAVASAITYLRRRRPQAVHIEIPTDVLGQKAEMNLSPDVDMEVLTPSHDHVKQAADILRSARRPLLWLGGGAAGASEHLTRLAELLGAAVVVTCAGKGVVPGDHPLNLGNHLRSEKLKQFVASSDAALIVGSQLAASETSSGEIDFPADTVRVDVDLSENRFYRPRLQIRSDAGLFARQLVDVLCSQQGDPGAGDEYRKEIEQLRGSLLDDEPEAQDQRKIIEVLRQNLGDEDILVCDMTVLCYRASSEYTARKPRSFLFPRGLGTLGWSMPAALGAKLARPERRVLSVCGDGGFLFTASELATAVKYKIPVPVLVLNNDSYGMVARIQKMRGKHEFGTDLTNPDFVDLARSFGAQAQRVNTPQKLDTRLQEAFSADGPTVIEMPVDF